MIGFTILNWVYYACSVGQGLMLVMCLKRISIDLQNERITRNGHLAVRFYLVAVLTAFVFNVLMSPAIPITVYGDPKIHRLVLIGIGALMLLTNVLSFISYCATLGSIKQVCQQLFPIQISQNVVPTAQSARRRALIKPAIIDCG